jgi:hypothetical protein
MIIGVLGIGFMCQSIRYVLIRIGAGTTASIAILPDAPGIFIPAMHPR